MERDFVITHMPEVFDEPVAEFALGLMLGRSKRLLPICRPSSGQSGYAPPPGTNVHRESALPVLLRGATLGIIGFGGIGRSLASMVRPLKMRVLGYRREPQPESAGRCDVWAGAARRGAGGQRLRGARHPADAANPAP